MPAFAPPRMTGIAVIVAAGLSAASAAIRPRSRWRR